MKVLIRILLLGLFALTIFIPRGTIPSWAYWSLFLLIFLMLFVYYRVEYYVSEKDVTSVTDTPILFSCFAAKVPPMSSEDLVRGRLILTETSFELYRKGSPATLAWSRQRDEVESIETGRAVGYRKGFIFNLKDGNSDSFAVTRHESVYEKLIAALGWQVE